jgi:hypothetical protein
MRDLASEKSCFFLYISFTILTFVSGLINGIQRQMIWFGLWCLMPLSTIFHLYRGGQFNWWRKSEYQLKTTLHNWRFGRFRVTELEGHNDLITDVDTDGLVLVTSR